MKRFAFFVPILLLVAVSPAFSQNDGNDDLQSAMQKLAKDAAKAYVAPVISGFGVDLNSGWFHRAPWANKFGFDFEFGVVAMATVFKDEQQTFATSGDFKFDYDQSDELAKQTLIQANQYPNPSLQANIRTQIMNQVFRVGFAGPTFIGKKTDSLRLSFPAQQITVGSTPYNVPAQQFTLGAAGTELPALPLAAPQLTIGTLFGTQFTFRYLPDIKLSDEIGNLKYSGFGIQHNPLVWFGEDALPFEVALGYFTQTLKLGSLMEAKASAFGVNTSIRLGWGFLNITPYAGFMLESSSISFAYDYEYQVGSTGQTATDHINFSADGENSSRFTFGASVKVLFINVNADINLGKYKAFSGGIMIII